MDGTKIVVAAMLFFVLLPSARAHFIDFSANSSVIEGGNITVIGTLYANDSTTPANATVTTTAGSSTNYSAANGTGYFNLTVAAPLTHGEHNITINTSETSRTVPVFVTNVTGGSVDFAGNNKPPFSAGESFLVNITIMAPNGTNLSSYRPDVRIFKADGGRVSWAATNYSGITAAAANQSYWIWNITIPSTASGGTYIISVEGGKVQGVVVISSTYNMALSAQTSNNETKLAYAPGTAVTFVTQIRSTSGSQTNATNITSRIKLPNGTSEAVTLSSVGEGKYQGSYTLASGTAGTYTFTATATVGSEIISGSLSLAVAQARAYLETQQDFYYQWGEKKAIAAGNPVGLNVIAINLSDNSIFSGRDGGGAGTVNCTSPGTQVMKITSQNGSAYSPSITYDAGGFKFMNPVCRIQFTAPNDTGTYRIDFNTTINSDITVAGVGYMDVQSFLLSVTPLRAIGAGGTAGFGDFASMYAPGTNITFSLAVFSLKNGRQVGGGNITSIRINKIRSMDFLSGSQEFSEGLQNAVSSFNITNFTLGSRPTITIMIPQNRTGPFNVEIEVAVRNLSTSTTNETVRGTGFYIAKVLMGWLGQSEGFAACGKQTNFTGSIYDMSSGQAVDGVTVEGISVARQEPAGKNIISCITVTRTTTNSTGYITVPVTINNTKAGCTELSEGNFIMFNVTYKGVSDEIPSWFMCRNYWFWVQANPWRVAPRGTVNLTIGGSVTRVSTNTAINSGQLKVQSVMSWSPGTGGRKLPMAVTVNGTYGGANTTALQLSPQNASESQWPEGFISLVMQFCDNSSVCDTSWSGFSVSAFDAYMDNAPWGVKFGKGDNISLIIRAATNVSRDSGNYSGAGSNTTTSGFNVTAGAPWGGRKMPASLAGAAFLVEDRWNNTNDTGYPSWGYEKWNVTITIPNEVEIGQNVLTIKVRNYANETTTVDFWFTVENYEVFVMLPERVDLQTAFTNSDNATLGTYGFNMSYLRNSLSVWSKGGTVCHVRGLNATRYYTTWPQNYGNSSISMLVIDNGTAGVYDTVVFNNTADAGYTITQKFGSYGGLYIYEIAGCNEFWIINSTGDYTSWAGEFEVSKNFTVAFRARRSTGARPAISGATISIDSVVSQYSGYGTGPGYGFQSKAEESDFVQSAGVTDSSGMAFVGLNMSQTGWFMALWKLRDSAGEEIRASFGGGYTPGAAGISFSVKGFNAWGNRVSRLGGTLKDDPDTSHANALFTLAAFNATAGNVWNYTVAANTTVYNGTFTEEHNGQYIRDNCLSNGTDATSKIYAVYVPASRMFVIDNDDDMNAAVNGSDSGGGERWGRGCDSTADQWQTINWSGEVQINTTAAAGPGSRIERFTEPDSRSTVWMLVSAINTSGNTTRAALFEYEGNDQNLWYSINHSMMNVTVSVCAVTVSRPVAPYEGASVYLELETWSMGSFTPTATALSWFDPIAGTKYTFGARNATTGPQGCVALDVVHPTGWPSNFWGSIKGKVTANVSGTMRTENNVYAGSISRW